MDGFSVAQGIKRASTQAGRDDPEVRRADVQTGIVTAVGATPGTVDVGSIRARRLETYLQPAVGDQVLLVQSGTGNWWAAGRTASGTAPLGVPRHVYKTANLDRTSATLTDDPELTMQLDANAVYHIEFHLFHAAVNAARFRTAWTVPSGATGTRSALGPDQGVILSSTSSGGQGRFGVHAFTTACIYGSRDDNTLLCYSVEASTLFTTTAGACALQWAQQTASATFTRLAQGSYMRATRIA
ncbi:MULTISPECIES: hypothetical protein [Streptomyces]|uniref:Uncharacterized protein n=2 Tax=Streptomyces TaxID=1883 RepID=A0A2U9NYY0_STRAS|nr:hypothetical protein [Streptomyces actuosus]AWT42549.1 hypothetical protein DMT42_09625 [Streptomyces actuosus]MBM4819752.1 hypothetical protein [Streptomyces actuosus]